MQKIAEEVELGRVSPGMTVEAAEALLSTIQTAPMAVVPQKNKNHIVIDHSYPKCRLPLPHIHPSKVSTPTELLNNIDPSNTLINSLIDSDDYPCDWGTFSDCCLLIADAPKGTQVAVFDVDAAFRNIPLHPSVWKFICLLVDGLIHLDLMLNFGE